MFYTRKGDKGTSKLFSTEPGVRIPKTDPVFAALGNVDELNSYLGVIRAMSRTQSSTLVSGTLAVASTGGVSFEDMLYVVQDHLFTLQAFLAGAPKALAEEHVLAVEKYIADMVEQLPPADSFVVPGQSLLDGHIHFARTIARRAERSLVEVSDRLVEGDQALPYLNRLSSLLYVMARYANHKAGIGEQAPEYRAGA